MVSSLEKADLGVAWYQAGGRGAARQHGARAGGSPARRRAGLKIGRAGSSGRACAAAGDAILLRSSAAAALRKG